MKNNYFFSVIIPTYESKRLKPGLDSIEAQQNKEDIEVIIVDDNSTDKTYLDILNNYSFHYKVIYNEKNLGPGGARQVGLDAATGQWITFLDHDDAFNPNCFSPLKELIQKSKCEAIFETQIIVAKDDQWIKTGEYAVSAEDCWLHGRFFNRKFLLKNGIRFHTKIFAQEDIYFCAISAGVAALSEELQENGIVTSPIITYYWYLWEDSTSHQKKNGRSYLMNYFQDFITSNYDTMKFLDNRFHNEQLKRIKLTSCLMYSYLFYEKYYYSYNILSQNNISLDDVFNYIKEFKAIMLKELNINNEELLSLMNEGSSAEMYYTFSQKINESLDGYFIPQHTLKEFLLMLE